MQARHLMKQTFLLNLIPALSGVFAYSQTPLPERHSPLSFEAAYIGENMNVIKGGIKNGSGYEGMATMILDFTTDKANLWKGGVLRINMVNTHGSSPSGEFIGDYQVASNIQAGNHSFIQELWYSQTFGPVTLTAGLQDLNVEFAWTENGLLYLNSSFGIPPTLTGNIPASVFPLTTPGLTVNWTINDKITWINAIYDGSPTDFENNNYNLKWRLSKADGIFTISEVSLSYSISQKPGKIKAGIYNHTHLLDQYDYPAGHDTTYSHKTGLYIIADQVLWQHPSLPRYLATFIQFGLSPDDYHYNQYYLGFGLNYYGLFNSKGKDALGLAVAHAGLHANHYRESSIELTYRFPVLYRLFLQPDIQYIINPCGLNKPLGNCMVASFRFGFSF